MDSAALGEVVVALGPSLPVLAEFIGVLARIAVPVLLLLAKVLGLLTPVLNLMSDAIAEFSMWLDTIDWGQLGADIGAFFVDVWHDVLDFFKNIGKFFSELPGKVRSDFKAMHDAIVARVAAMIAFVKALPGRVVAAIGNFAMLANSCAG